MQRRKGAMVGKGKKEGKEGKGTRGKKEKWREGRRRKGAGRGYSPYQS